MSSLVERFVQRFLRACLRIQPLRRQSLGGVRPSPGAETSAGPPAWNDSGIAGFPTLLRPRTGALRHLIFKHALSRNDAVGNRELRSAVPVGQRFQPVHEFTNANTKRFGQTNVHFPVPTALQGGTGRMPVLPSTASFRLRACLKMARSAVIEQKAGWQGATKENTLHGSSTQEQRSQTAFCSITLRAAGLLAWGLVVACVTARCGEWPVRLAPPPAPPRPNPKSPAAAPLAIFRLALRKR